MVVYHRDRQRLRVGVSPPACLSIVVVAVVVVVIVVVCARPRHAYRFLKVCETRFAIYNQTGVRADPENLPA